MKLKYKLCSLLTAAWYRKAQVIRQRLNNDIDAVIDSLKHRELNTPAMMTCIRPLLPMLVITVLLHGLFFYEFFTTLISGMSLAVDSADEMLLLQLKLGTGLFVLSITAVSGFLFFLIFQNALFFMGRYFTIPEDIRGNSVLFALTRRTLAVILYPGAIFLFSLFIFPDRVQMNFTALNAFFCAGIAALFVINMGLLFIKNTQHPHLNATMTKFRQLEPVSSRQTFLPVIIAQCSLVGFLLQFQFLTDLRSGQEIAVQFGLILFSIFTLMVIANEYFRLKDDCTLNSKKTDLETCYHYRYSPLRMQKTDNIWNITVLLMFFPLFFLNDKILVLCLGALLLAMTFFLHFRKEKKDRLYAQHEEFMEDTPESSAARKKLNKLGYTLLATFTMTLLARLALPLPDGLRYSFMIECLILLPLTSLLLPKFRYTLSSERHPSMVTETTGR